MHWLVCGESGTGKTSWAKLRVKEARAEGVSVIVLDPFLDDWGQDDAANNADGVARIRVTADRATFLKWYWESELSLCVVDESAITAPRGDEDMLETAILGRHQGHTNMYLCQRVAQVHPTIRGQCSHLVVFGCSNKDAKILADDEFDNEGLYAARTLPPGTYLYLHRRGEISQEKIF